MPWPHHQTTRPETPPCRLCGPLAQPTTHFDRDWWKAIKAEAERSIVEARAEIAEADKHLRMLAEPPPLAALLERR